MTRKVVHTLLVALLAALTTVVYGGISVPDAVFYGRIMIDCQPLTTQDNVKVMAKVDGVAKPVGTCRMRARAPLGDHYSLHVRLESGADGSPHGDDAARLGDTVHISVQQGDNLAQHVADVVVTEIGLVSQLNLKYPVTPCPGDSDEDGDADLYDFSMFQRCFTGLSGSPAPECAQCDFDVDSDIDLDDWRRIRAVFFGPW